MKSVFAFLVFVLLTTFASAQTTTGPLFIEARTGELVTLKIQITDRADTINIYRKTGVTSTPALMDALTVKPDVWEYEWSYKMPGGTAVQYRFFAVPKFGAELLEESNGVRLKRMK